MLGSWVRVPVVAQMKNATCIDCGKEILINNRASILNCRCEDCKKNHHPQSHYKICKICGSAYYKYEHGCKNDFCKNHSIQQIRTLIKYFGFDESKLGTNKVEQEFNRVRDKLCDLYWNQKLSSVQICKLFNYPNVGNLTAKVFAYLNIPSKNSKEANCESYLYGRNKIHSSILYKQQWHTTWNNKKVYLHSSYELDYAKQLDDKQIDYDVESLHIKYWDSQQQRYRCAIPDFYIPSKHLIVEIKSNWTLDKQNMQDKENSYRKLGYNFKLICDKKEIKI